MTSDAFSRTPLRVLLAVCGTSPQIITETVYALVTEGRFVPNEVAVLTTTKGKAILEETLLALGTGAFHALCRDLNVRIAFDAAAIRVIENKAGEPLSDLRTEDELTAAGDTILNTVREYSNRDDVLLHVSIAGGRKTMGFYAGSALSLFGRATDELSHVVIDAAFENVPDFFYPSQEEQSLTGRSGEALAARDCYVTLSRIPFLRLRSRLDERLLSEPMNLAAFIEAAQPVVGEAQVVVDLPQRQIVCNGRAVALDPSPLAIYWMLARRRMEKKGPADPRTAECLDEYLKAYQWILNKGRILPPEAESPKYLRIEKQVEAARKAAKKDAEGSSAIRQNIDTFDFVKPFREASSRIAKALRPVLGEEGVRRYGIEAVGRKPCTLYRIPVPPNGLKVRNFDMVDAQASS